MQEIIENPKFEAAVGARIAFNSFFDELSNYRFKITEGVSLSLRYMQAHLLENHKWALQDASLVVAMSKLQPEGELTYREIYAVHNIFAGASGQGVAEAEKFMDAVHSFAPAIAAIHDLDRKQNALSQACTDTSNAYTESLKESGEAYRDVDDEAEKRYEVLKAAAKESEHSETEVFVKEISSKSVGVEKAPVGFCAGDYKSTEDCGEVKPDEETESGK